MGDGSLTRLAGIFSLLSAACLIGAMALGISLGGKGPGPIDFGDPQVLAQLRTGGKASLVLELLALIAPTLSLGAGLGWYPLLRDKGGYVAIGILLWYVGMIFVIWQDAMEFALAAWLPDLHAGVEGTRAEALLAIGAMGGRTIEIFMLLGDLLSFCGILIVCTALLRGTGSMRLIGACGAASAILICAGLLFPPLSLARLVGFLLFLIWMIAMGVLMLRWQPGSARFRE